MFNLHSAHRSAFFAALLILGAISQACSSYEMARLKRMNFSDDLYASADEGPSPRVSSRDGGSNPYHEYLEDGQSVRRSTRSNRLDRYQRDLEWADRFGNPLWSNPSWNYGMGGFYGCRSYMLYNPFLPPYWGMNPGFSMGWGSPYGFNRPWGYDPWLYGGPGWGMYDPWGWNTWNSPWCNNWGMNSYWGWNNGWNGWNHGGSGIWVSATPALKPSPTRTSLPGSSLPGFVQRGKSRAPARVPNAMAGNGFSGQLLGAESQTLSSRVRSSQSTVAATRNGSGQTRRMVGTQSMDRSASGDRNTMGAGVSRTLRSTDRTKSADIRYPYATPGTGRPEDFESNPSRSGSVGSYTPPSYTSYRSGSSGTYTPPSYSPSRSGSSGTNTPSSYTPYRSGSSGSSGANTPRTSTPSAPSRTNSSFGSSTPARPYSAPRSSGSYSPSSPSRSSSSGSYSPSSPSRSSSSGSNSLSTPSRSSSSGYSRPSTPSYSGTRPTTSGRPR